MSGTLFIVATPIGNLEDLTPRARQALQSVSLIAAEDTRHTGRLLLHIGAKPRQIALHDHNESEAVDGIIRALESGVDVALVSDAGTPLVSDPGYRLVSSARDEGINVVPIPGVSAVTAAAFIFGRNAHRVRSLMSYLQLVFLDQVRQIRRQRRKGYIPISNKFSEAALRPARPWASP